jgi:3-phenylpropionate/trans-cinnamate dioxygenase ferredoxin subunit
MNGFEKVAQRSEIKAGELKVVEAQGEAVVLTELAGQVIALSNVCSHEDCDFVFEGQGSLNGAEIECGCHGSAFNVLSGAVLTPPATQPITVYAVQVIGDEVSIGPR